MASQACNILLAVVLHVQLYNTPFFFILCSRHYRIVYVSQRKLDSIKKRPLITGGLGEKNNGLQCWVISAQICCWKVLKVNCNVALKSNLFTVYQVYSARDRWSCPSLKCKNLECAKGTGEVVADDAQHGPPLWAHCACAELLWSSAVGAVWSACHAIACSPKSEPFSTFIQKSTVINIMWKHILQSLYWRSDAWKRRFAKYPVVVVYLREDMGLWC